MAFTSSPPRWRDVYLAAGARAVSYCGDLLAATALALTMQARGDNGYGVAALLMAAALPVALLAPLAGWLADRVDSRLLLVSTGATQAAICTLLAFTGHPTAMVALVAALSAGLAITQPTISALVPDMVGREQLPKAMSISQTAGAVGMLAGPALGGVLVGTFGMRLPLLLDAASYLALVAAGLAIRTRRGRIGARASREPAPAATGAGNAETAAAWRLRDDRLMVTLLVAAGSVIAAVTAVNVVEVFYVRETLGGSESTYGLVETLWTLGVLAGAWPFGRLRGADDRLVATQLLLLIGLSLVVLGSAGVPSAGWLFPLYLVGGMLNAGLNVLAGVVVGRRAPAAVRGRVFGTFTAVGNGGSMFGYAVGGALMPLAQPRAIIAGAAVAGILVGAGFLVPMLAQVARTRIAAEPAAPVGYRAET